MINLKILKITVFFFAIVILLSLNSCKKESILAEAKFTFSGSLDEIPAQIQFTNNSFGISYVWDFGDKTSSSEKNPIHTYNEYGLYKVKLTAKGSSNIDTLIQYILIGGNLGQIGDINCDNSINNTNFKIGKTYSNETVQIPYTRGNGGVHNSFTVNSTGVLGLKAKLNKGNFNSGDGNLEFLISGTPISKGFAKFKIDLVGKNCELNVFVTDTIFNLPTDGLICWWPFNGNANDVSGNGKHGTVNGATLTIDRFGNINQAYSFDGLNDFIKTPPPNPLNKISISLWAYDYGDYPIFPNSFNPRYISSEFCFGGFALFNNHYNSPNGIVFTRNRGTFEESIFSTLKTSLTKWQHIAFTYDGNIGLFYINGNLLKSIQNIGPITIGSNVFIGSSGCDFNKISDNFNGKLDDIGIWNRVLTQEEIKSLYNLK